MTTEKSGRSNRAGAYVIIGHKQEWPVGPFATLFFRDNMAKIATTAPDKLPLSPKLVLKLATLIWRKVYERKELDLTKITFSAGLLPSLLNYEKKVREFAKLAKRLNIICNNRVKLPLFTAKEKYNIARRFGTLASELYNGASGFYSTCTTYQALEPKKMKDHLIGYTNTAWLMSIYKDLLNLPKNFNNCFYNRKDKTISATTEEIWLQGINFGPFRIDWHLNHFFSDRFYNVVALKPNIPLNSVQVTHPHVSNHRVCEGDSKLRLNKCWSNGWLCEAFNIIRQILLNYNSNSPYQTIERWHEKESQESQHRLFRYLLLGRAHDFTQLATGCLNTLSRDDGIPPKPVPVIPVPAVSQVQNAQPLSQPEQPARVASAGGFLDEINIPPPATVAARNGINAPPSNVSNRVRQHNVMGPINVEIRELEMMWCGACERVLTADQFIRCGNCSQGTCRTHRVIGPSGDLCPQCAARLADANVVSNQPVV